MKALKVSAASQEQQTEILQILQETQQWLRYRGINQWTLRFTAEWITESIAKGEFFCGQVDQDIIAVFRLTDNDSSMWGDRTNDAIYIHSLAVVRRWRGYGIGQYLLQWIEGYAAQAARRYLRLDCLADNLALCRYYEQAGFVSCKVKDIRYADGSSYQARLFEKVVGKVN
ncbi:MAG: GNAT family N-acetyltransferase [Chloroflexota bacterium]